MYTCDAFFVKLSYYETTPEKSKKFTYTYTSTFLGRWPKKVPVRDKFWTFGSKFARKKAKFLGFARKCDAFFVNLYDYGVG